MPGLCGAWSLGGATIGSRLGPEERRLLRRSLPTRGALSEHEDGPLWLVCGERFREQEGRSTLALSGFVAAAGVPKLGLPEALRRRSSGAAPDIRLEGHYAAVFADSADARLELYRDPSGGERLYYAVLVDLLLFGTSVRPLLAHPRVARRVNPETLGEALLCGQILFGNPTLFEGIFQVLPGHRLSVSGGKVRHEWHWGELLRGPEGSPESLAPRLVKELSRAVLAAAPADGRVGIALSGGIDSSSIAAVAVEALGAENVEAFTYEMDERFHVNETHYAARVCAHLGIRRHHVVRLSYDDFVASVVETVWRSESPFDWTKFEALPLARRAAAEGVETLLTGDGFGSRMTYFEDLAAAARLLGSPERLARLWLSDRAWLRQAAGLLHPGLAQPFSFVSLPVLAALRAAGARGPLETLLPPSMRSWFLGMVESERVRAALVEAPDRPLDARLQRLCFTHMATSWDRSRTEKLSRESGVYRVSPGFFPSVLPFSHFPFRPRPFVFSPARRAASEKVLLSRAMRGVLPDEILKRPKSLQQTQPPSEWRQRMLWDLSHGVLLSQEAMDPFFDRRASADEPASRVGSFHTAALCLWHRLFIGARSLDSLPSLDALRREP